MTISQDVLSHHLAQALRPFETTERGAAPRATAVPTRGLKLLFSVHRFRQRIEFNFVLVARVAADLETLVLPGLPEASVAVTPRPSAGPAVVSASASVRRRDELWKTTCLEVFVGRADRTSYFEMNLAPGGDWNVYAFDNYRAGMCPAPNVRAPLTRVERASVGEAIAWHGALSGPDFDDLLEAPGLVMNATAVLEYKSGVREHWALVHAPEKPDFHFREGFRLPL